MDELIELEGVIYRAEKTKRGWLRLKPVRVKKLKKTAKSELLKRFSKDDLMDELIKRLDEPRREKVIIEEI